MIGAMVRHWLGISLARCNNFSSSSLFHSVFLIEGSSHSYQRALHCFADFRVSKLATRAHWHFPYFMTAALRISSSVFFQTPPLIRILIFQETILPKRSLRSMTFQICRRLIEKAPVMLQAGDIELSSQVTANKLYQRTPFPLLWRAKSSAKNQWEPGTADSGPKGNEDPLGVRTQHHPHTHTRD